MTELLTYCIASFLFTSFIFKLLLSTNNNKIDIIKIYDYPDDRKIHSEKVMKIGGIVILFTSLLSLLIYRILNEESLFYMIAIENRVVLATVFLIIGSILDDLISIDAFKKLFFQIIAIFVAISSSFIILLFSNYYANVTITIIFFILVINSMNLIDGINGLSTGLFLLFSITFILLLNFIPILDSRYYMLISIFIGSVASFFIFNFPSAKVFLGDTGSQILGWIIALLIIQLSSFFDSSYEKLYLCSFLSLPLYDVLFVMIKRYFTSKGSIYSRLLSVVRPDQNHIHHLILKSNINSFRSMLLLTAFFGLCLILSALPIIYNRHYFLVFIFVLTFNILFRLFFEFRSLSTKRSN